MDSIYRYCGLPLPTKKLVLRGSQLQQDVVWQFEESKYCGKFHRMPSHQQLPHRNFRKHLNHVLGDVFKVLKFPERMTMDPLTLILTALISGATASVKDTASQ